MIENLNIFPQLVEDYISNVEGREIDKIIHIEDLLDSIPGKEDQYDGYFGLFEVFFKDNTKDKYILSINNSAQMVFKANDAILSDLFPSHVQKDI